MMFLKKPANPLIMEDVGGESEYLIPFSRSIAMKLQSQSHVTENFAPAKKISKNVDELESTFARPNPLIKHVKQHDVGNMRKLRDEMNIELEKMKKIIDYQKSALNNSIQK